MRGPRGFTLIELLAVLVILGVLVAALMSSGIFSAVFGKREEARTEQAMREIQMKLDGIGRELGQYPPSSWQGFRRFASDFRRKLRGVDERRLQGGSAVNEGSEILFLSFEALGDKPSVDEELVGDTDEDGFFEYLDAWGHPIVYLRCDKAGVQGTVLSLHPDGGLEPTLVEALPSKTDKRRPRGQYQLLSGGGGEFPFEERDEMVAVIKD
jgi:prepilin-type N-terminal cleavage/methylation domain-containing protein